VIHGVIQRLFTCETAVPSDSSCSCDGQSSDKTRMYSSTSIYPTRLLSPAFHVISVIYHLLFITYKFKVFLEQFFFLSDSIFWVSTLHIMCAEEPGMENEITGKNYGWNIRGRCES
jgi:hypothetical protein